MSSHYLNQWELYVFLGTTATNIYEKWLLSFCAVVFSIVLDKLSSPQTGDVSKISVVNWHYIWQLWWLQLSYGNQDCSIVVLIYLISSQHKQPVLCALCAVGPYHKLHTILQNILNRYLKACHYIKNNIDLSLWGFCLKGNHNEYSTYQ